MVERLERLVDKNPKIMILSPAKVAEPLGVMYLSSVLKKDGFSVRGALIEKDDVAKEFEAYRPDIVLYSMITGEHKVCLEANRELKEKYSFVSVFGGPHVTFFPDIIEEKGVDIVGLGECDLAIVDLIGGLAKGEDVTCLDNFWVKTSEKIYRNGVRPLIKDLDVVPFPDRSLFAQHRDDNEFCLLTSRGCPYNCTFCFNEQFRELYKGKGKGTRFRSTESILEEIEDIQNEHEVDMFNFHDDIFVMNKKRLREFSKRYGEEVGVPFICSVRANVVDEEVVELLSDAGCAKVFMGIEAGNDDVRYNLLDRKITKECMLEAHALFRRYGIPLFAQNIVGFPTTTLENDFETLEFNIDLKPDFAWVSIFTPYPKTVLGELCIEKGLIKSFDDIYSTYHYKSPLNVPHRNQIPVVHKLFSMTVDHPELLPKVKELAADPNSVSFERLHDVFVAYRVYKYDKLLDPNLELPHKVKKFMAELGYQA